MEPPIFTVASAELCGANGPKGVKSYDGRRGGGMSWRQSHQGRRPCRGQHKPERAGALARRFKRALTMVKSKLEHSMNEVSWEA